MSKKNAMNETEDRPNLFRVLTVRSSGLDEQEVIEEIWADEFEVEDGILTFDDTEGNNIASFARGRWASVIAGD